MTPGVFYFLGYTLVGGFPAYDFLAPKIAVDPGSLLREGPIALHTGWPGGQGHHDVYTGLLKLAPKNLTGLSPPTLIHYKSPPYSLLPLLVVASGKRPYS